jgi:thioredoxin 1
MKNIVNLVLAAGAVVMLAGWSGCSCPCCKHDHDAKTEVAKSTDLLSVTTIADFDKEVLKSEKPVIVDFWATWCGACVEMKPVFEKLAKELGDKYKFVSINVDNAAPELSKEYGIKGIPAFLFFSNGALVGEAQVGSMSQEVFKAEIEKRFAVKSEASLPESEKPAAEDHAQSEEK